MFFAYSIFYTSRDCWNFYMQQVCIQGTFFQET